MRIVYTTDVHGAFKPLKVLLENTHADLYVIAGDLVKGAFRSSRSFFRFSDLDRHFNHLKCRSRTEVATRNFVEKLVTTGGTSPEEKRQGKEYLRLHRLAKTTLQKEMASLEAVLASFPDKRTMVLPGNYDMDLQGTELEARDLHKKVQTFEGLKIAGYGGANVATPGIPEDLTVPFREVQSGGSLQSEPRDFLSEVRPDLVVLHMPPFGYLDLLRSYGNLGSVGVRDYIDQFSPKIVLCGHMHDSWGVVSHGGTVVINPSNFGHVTDINGVRRGGYFFDFIMEGRSYRVGSLRQLERGKIYDLADYPCREDNSLKPLIVDPKRMHFLSREKAQGGRVIQQIRDFNGVRDFFRHYETEATRQRLEDLRRIYRKLRAQGEQLAFDVLGSVNFGMSEPGSDVDLVIYRRCPCQHPLPETACTLPKALWECFKGLEDRYRIDVTDCVNLEKVEASIRSEDAACPALQRFVLYRAICRPINLRMIRETENLLLARPGLKKKVEYLLKDHLKMMVLSHSHILSFKKYESRLHEQGVNLPASIEQKLHAYLGLKN